MGYMRQIGVYRYVNRRDALKSNGGRKPIKVRWVDTDKGDRYRSRLVAMEFRKKSETWSAEAPPLDILRMPSRFLPDRRRGARRPMVMAVGDVKRARVHAHDSRRRFVELPKEGVRFSF